MNAPVTPQWNAMDRKAREELILAERAEGKSARQIADKAGTSRSSIIGYMTRMGGRGIKVPASNYTVAIREGRKQGGIMGGKPGKNLRAARAKAKKSEGAEMRRRTSSTGHDADESPAPITITKAAAFTPLPGVEPLPLVKVGIGTGRCCWPVYDGDEPYRFCGADCSTRAPYCASHAALAGSAYHPSKTGKEAS